MKLIVTDREYRRLNIIALNAGFSLRELEENMSEADRELYHVHHDMKESMLEVDEEYIMDILGLYEKYIPVLTPMFTGIFQTLGLVAQDFEKLFNDWNNKIAARIKARKHKVVLKKTGLSNKDILKAAEEMEIKI
jgi:hypothetical protein